MRSLEWAEGKEYVVGWIVGVCREKTWILINVGDSV